MSEVPFGSIAMTLIISPLTLPALVLPVERSFPRAGVGILKASLDPG